jgi:hypothetical protein
MAKKILIPRKSLPDINSITESYSVRFRLTNENRSKFSYWSPIFNISPDFIYEFDSSAIDISKSSNHMNIIWEPVTIKKAENIIGPALQYDIWVQWSKEESDADWLYKERVEGSSLSLLIPEDYSVNGVLAGSKPNKIAVEIYLRGSPIIRNTNLLTYQDSASA